jgi:ATP-binding cassette, subfamily B, bacterial
MLNGQPFYLIRFISNHFGSSIDAENEAIIMPNLEEFYDGKTVVIIAHRLSTVKRADQIAVMRFGQITELGTHSELVQKQGFYFNLVKNQLELTV